MTISENRDFQLLLTCERCGTSNRDQEDSPAPCLLMMYSPYARTDSPLPVGYWCLECGYMDLVEE